MLFLVSTCWGSFLARRALWVLNRCLLAENADYSCSLIGGMVKVTSPLIVAESELRFSFRVRALAEILTWYVKLAAGKRRGILIEFLLMY